MSEDPATAAAARTGKPHTQRFRRAANAVLLTADQRRRQALLMTLAWNAFRSRERTMAFLNEPCADLGGRPLDVAIDSDVGLGRVSALLNARASASGDRGATGS